MLSFSMSVSIDGFVEDRNGRFDWTVPDDDTFRAHLEEVSALGGYLLGRKLYELMLVWETDPAMRSDELRAAFADAWTALPKVVFSRTLDRVEGENTRLATGSLEDEIAASLEATDREVSIGGPDLAGQAFELGLLEQLRIFRHPVVLGGGTPYVPRVADPVQMVLAETRQLGERVVFERWQRA
jgi:dihydrofolate reductase